MKTRLPIFLALTMAATSSFGQKNTIVPLAANVKLNIDGVYPAGYKPSWQYVNNKEAMPLTITNYMMTRGNVVQENTYLGFKEVNGKLVLQIQQRRDQCLADLETPQGAVTLTETPTTFSLVNWRNENGGPCSQNVSLRTYEGQLSLSANRDGDLNMSIKIDIYSAPGRKNEVAHTYGYVGNNISIPNKLTPGKAATTAVDDEKKRVDRIESEKRQAIYAKERARLDSLYQKILPTYQAKMKTLIRTKTEYKGYAMKTIASLKELLPVKRACFVGVKGSEALEEQSARDYLMARDMLGRKSTNFKPSEIEPHERDGEFATMYLYAKVYNDLLAQLAARYSICDKEYVDSLLSDLKNALQLVDNEEYNRILEFMGKKN